MLPSKIALKLHALLFSPFIMKYVKHLFCDCYNRIEILQIMKCQTRKLQLMFLDLIKYSLAAKKHHNRHKKDSTYMYCISITSIMDP